MKPFRLPSCMVLAVGSLVGVLSVLSTFAAPSPGGELQNAWRRDWPASAFHSLVSHSQTIPPQWVGETGLAGQPRPGIPKTSHRLIVELESPALAVWRTETGAPRSTASRLDLQSQIVQDYLTRLEAEQAGFIAAMQTALPGASVSTYINENGRQVSETFKVVLNAVVVEPGAAGRDKALRILSALPGVKNVHLDYAYSANLYTSTALINAPVIWNNAAMGGRANAGRGIKMASMDGGVHKDAPMFDGTGFRYPKDLPSKGLGLTANNNGKIIASRAYFRAWDPPAPGDENPWPGESGTPHGVHTAGIAAGNSVSATYAGLDLGQISGVAPAAWIMSYRVFYNSISGDGSFYTAEGIAALEDIVKDGADVVNNSWGVGPTGVGGKFDALDQALIHAARAGVFVVMAAGNAGPGHGTTDHPSDDYIIVAASTTSGTLFIGQMSVIAPEPVSTTLRAISYGTASFGERISFGTVVTHSFMSALSVNPENVEGCEPWAGRPFAGRAVLISRGTCNFANKIYYAQQAGATFVVVYNHEEGGDTLMNMGCGGDYCDPGEITIASIFVGHTHGLEMVNWYATHEGASVLEVRNVGFQVGNQADRIASFSSRGPGVGHVLKPDIAAPGVNILSQGYAPGTMGEARHLGFGQISGTSMAAPHVAGAAALLRQIHPDWSNAYIKSALMSTARYMDIYNHDGTPAQPLDMGAGRLDLTHAADPGLILQPPSLSYGQILTGTTKSLPIRVTNIATRTETYHLTTLYTGKGFTMTTELPGFTVMPDTITLNPGDSTALIVELDSTAGMGVGDHQGFIVLEGDRHHAHLPVWARVIPEPAADVLIIDNDGSASFGYTDYVGYYTRTLEALGYSYNVLDVDALVDDASSFLPDAASLSAYRAILYFTGDNFRSNGSSSVPTPLTRQDMNRLTEYANSGGVIIALGQDLASVLGSTSSRAFFYGYVLGGGYLQDSVTRDALPAQPVVPMGDVPPAFGNLYLDLGGLDTYRGTASLSGTNEVRPAVTKAGGLATFTYDLTNKALSYQLEVTTTETITITAAHIHSGTVGVNGPILHTLFDDSAVVTDTFKLDGAMILSDAEEALLVAGNLYVNVHTEAYPAGELRGQIETTPEGDGASNQRFIDEIVGEPDTDPDDAELSALPFTPLLKYPGSNNKGDGVVTMTHRDQPTLERPGISYYGRSIYTTFGLEGVNNGVGATSREELLGTFLNWAWDEPSVAISETTMPNASALTTFEATVTSNVADAGGLSYRWDFGDGSGFAGPYAGRVAGHTYTHCGTYTVRVEAIDSFGNRAIGTTAVEVRNDQCEMGRMLYLPLLQR